MSSVFPFSANISVGASSSSTIELSSDLNIHQKNDQKNDQKNAISCAQVWQILSPLLSDARRERLQKVVAERSYHIVPVLENLYDRGNTSAVLRTCEGLGFGRVDLIEPGTRFKEANRVTKGADKWLEVNEWKSSQKALTELKSLGYKIALTRLHPDARPIQELDFSQPTAFIFGNEKEGVSDESLKLADCFVTIPLLGFVESFNVSVAAAMILFYCRERLHAMDRGIWGLNEEQIEILQAHFAYRSLQSSESILLRHLFSERP